MIEIRPPADIHSLGGPGRHPALESAGAVPTYDPSVTLPSAAGASVDFGNGFLRTECKSVGGNANSSLLFIVILTPSLSRWSSAELHPQRHIRVHVQDVAGISADLG